MPLSELPERHWTSVSIDDFLYRVGFDYITQLEHLMQTDGINQARMAQMLGVTEGRVSQVLNNPGNLTLRKVIEYARTLGKKVAIVAYDDHDPDNHNGPINAQVFTRCWELAGSPADFFEISQTPQTVASTGGSANLVLKKVPGRETHFFMSWGPDANTGFRTDVSSVPVEMAISTDYHKREIFYGRG